MQNVSVDVTDLLATNGILHIISQVRQEKGVPGTSQARKEGLTAPPALCQVLLPPRGSVQTGPGLLQQLDRVPAFHLFREQLKVKEAHSRGVRSWGVPGRAGSRMGTEDCLLMGGGGLAGSRMGTEDCLLILPCSLSPSLPSTTN